MPLTLETAKAKENAKPAAEYRHPLKHFRDLAIANGVICEEDDMGVLRKACIAGGLSKADWRFLNRYGRDAYAAVFSMVDTIENMFEMVLLYVIWQCRGGLMQPLASELGHRFIACVGGFLDSGFKIDPRIARVAHDHRGKLTNPVARDDFCREEWMRVINWICDEQPVFDRNQWRSGWPAIYRCYQKWQRLNSNRNCWVSMLPGFEQGGFRVLPLTSSYELALEGYRMRHCVATYTRRCLAGNYRLFSVSMISSGQPLATIGIMKEDNYWKIDQIKGRFNRVPEVKVARFGLIIQRQYMYQEELKARSKILEHERCVRQLRKKHGRFLSKQYQLPKGLKNQFSTEEVEILQNQFVWLGALASGVLQPNDYAQVRFIAVTRGILRPETEAEKAWLKYQRLIWRLRNRRTDITFTPAIAR